MKKILLLSLISLLLPFLAQAQSSNQIKIGVMSDIHIMAPSLLKKDGKAFEEYIERDRKTLKEGPEILHKIVGELIEDKVDVVFVSGDLTKDGEAASYEIVRDELQRLRDKGITVYVVPGNHDINNPHAVEFDGDETRRVKTFSREEFAEFFSDFGYSQAIARDTSSLSYVAKLQNGTRLLALDACRYDDNDFDLDKCVTAGRFKKSTFKFIKEQLKEAKKSGDKVMVMVHHGIVEHWTMEDMIMSVYLVKNWKKAARLFARYDVNLIFTGHFHAQDIAQFKKKPLYDIETGSTVSYPHPYRIVTVSGNKADVKTKYINSVPSLSDEKEFLSKSESYAMAAIEKMVREQLPSNVPSELRNRGAEALGRAFVAHLKGDEEYTPELKSEIKSLSKELRKYTIKYSVFLKMLAKSFYTDISPKDNDIVLEF